MTGEEEYNLSNFDGELLLIGTLVINERSQTPIFLLCSNPFY